mmetsp:Transcript_50490/g.80127  ORF Transcript_50490/g.80127 Transcript_50490/m.80127 type:complete len:100 (+) Transcript_50490:377-676(+)
MKILHRSLYMNSWRCLGISAAILSGMDGIAMSAERNVERPRAHCLCSHLTFGVRGWLPGHCYTGDLQLGSVKLHCHFISIPSACPQKCAFSLGLHLSIT